MREDYFRLIRQFQLNLADRYETARGINTAKDIRRKINLNLETLVHALNGCRAVKEKIYRRDLGRIVMFPDRPIRRGYKKKNILPHSGLGMRLRPENFERLAKKIVGELDIPNTSGFFIRPVDFRPSLYFPIHKTGLMVAKTTLSEHDVRTLYHEMIHADMRTYSKNIPRIINRNDYDPVSITFSCEGYYLDEINAYKSEFQNSWLSFRTSPNAFDITRRLKDHYSDMYADSFSRVACFNRRQLEMIEDKLDYAMLCTQDLVNKLGTKLVTPILYSIGPTEDEVYRRRFHSLLDDVVAWHKAVEKGQIKKRHIKALLSEKGYD